MTSTTKQRLTIFINPALLKHAKAQGIVEDITLSHLIEKSLILYLPDEIVIKKSKIIVDTDRNK